MYWPLAKFNPMFLGFPANPLFSFKYAQTTLLYFFSKYSNLFLLLSVEQSSIKITSKFSKPIVCLYIDSNA